MRRTRALVLVLALVFPVAAFAADADQDPNGASAPVTMSGGFRASVAPWLDSVLRVLLGQLGI